MSAITNVGRSTGARKPAARRNRMVAVAAATAVNLLVWVVAVPLAGVDLLVRSGTGGQRVGPLAVAAVTLLAGVAAWGLLALLERITRRAALVWTVTAGAVLVVSLAGPLGSGTGTTARLILSGMHLVAGAVLIPGLRRTATRS